MCAINCDDCEDNDTCELRPSVTEYNKRTLELTDLKYNFYSREL